ncbi:MAG: transcriptional regulator [Alkalinema sp. CAN_BIN05]|nr:transcriptional regulator [Alkalinema sp. CAN_BIN05]
MTVTIDRKRYAEVLSLYQPHVIKTESENEAFLALVEELMSRPQLTTEEDAVLELLVSLIEEFESQHYPIGTSTPHSILLHLMDARSLEPTDLIPVLGSIDMVNAILNDRTPIQASQAIGLGEFFHVTPELFGLGI